MLSMVLINFIKCWSKTDQGLRNRTALFCYSALYHRAILSYEAYTEFQTRLLKTARHAHNEFAAVEMLTASDAMALLGANLPLLFILLEVRSRHKKTLSLMDQGPMLWFLKYFCQ
jgi:formylmethanofuran dehydrogenase subunit A